MARWYKYLSLLWQGLSVSSKLYNSNLSVYLVCHFKILYSKVVCSVGHCRDSYMHSIWCILREHSYWIAHILFIFTQLMLFVQEHLFKTSSAKLPQFSRGLNDWNKWYGSRIRIFSRQCRIEWWHNGKCFFSNGFRLIFPIFYNRC